MFIMCSGLIHDSVTKWVWLRLKGAQLNLLLLLIGNLMDLNAVTKRWSISLLSRKIGKILISGNQTYELPMTITDSLSLVWRKLIRITVTGHWTVFSIHINFIQVVIVLRYCENWNCGNECITANVLNKWWWLMFLKGLPIFLLGSILCSLYGGHFP